MNISDITTSLVDAAVKEDADRLLFGDPDWIYLTAVDDLLLEKVCKSTGYRDRAAYFETLNL